MRGLRRLLMLGATGLALIAGIAAAGVGGASALSSTTTAPTTTTAVATVTTTTDTTTTPQPPVTATLPAGVIADGVSIGGVDVGGMTAWQARVAVLHAYRADLSLTLGRRTWHATVKQLGFYIYPRGAIAKALRIGRAAGALPGDIPLVTRFSGGGMKRYVRYLARVLVKQPVDARLILVDKQPHVIPDRWGLTVNRPASYIVLIRAVHDLSRAPVRIPTTVVRPAVRAATIGPSIIIDRGLHQLRLYNGEKLVRRFGVAVGQTRYPTPVGRFDIVEMQRNPTWTPPNAPWAAGAKPIPPGPGNPLGTRWMGLSSPGVGIHGTPDAASIGYSASHGCIRMQIPDAEWLFDHVRIGATVWIID